MTGLFETMLVADGRVVHLEEHYARMAASCVALGLPVPSFGTMLSGIASCSAGLRPVPHPEAGRRPALHEREAAVRCTYIPDRGLECVAFPIPAATRARREHGRAITLDPSWTRALPEHKTTDYDVCRRALERAVAAGADEALFVTRDGHVLEGTATNVFAVRGTTLITAPAGVLPGIVRAWVLAHAPELGFSIEERAPSVAEVREGAFFTGSLTRIAAVRVLDGEPCATRSVWSALTQVSALFR